MGLTDERYVDVPRKTRKPSLREGVVDSLLRQARSANASLNHVPANRAEARRLMRGVGPHMRFRYEVDDEGVRRGVRVRV